MYIKLIKKYNSKDEKFVWEILYIFYFYLYLKLNY